MVRTSKYKNTPSRRRHALRWRTTTAGMAWKEARLICDRESKCGKRETKWAANFSSQRSTKVSPRIDQQYQNPTGDYQSNKKESKYSLFFLNSGFPFFTDATTISPTPASGSLFSRAPKPYGSIRNKLFAPLLSAQLSTAPTGRPRVKRNFVPEAPPPKESSSIRVNHEVDVAYRELLPLLIGIR